MTFGKARLLDSAMRSDAVPPWPPESGAVSSAGLSSCISALGSALPIPPRGKGLPTLSLKLPETTCISGSCSIQKKNRVGAPGRVQGWAAGDKEGPGAPEAASEGSTHGHEEARSREVDTPQAGTVGSVGDDPGALWFRAIRILAMSNPGPGGAPATHSHTPALAHWSPWFLLALRLGEHGSPLAATSLILRKKLVWLTGKLCPGWILGAAWEELGL